MKIFMYYLAWFCIIISIVCMIKLILPIVFSCMPPLILLVIGIFGTEYFKT